MTLAEAMVRVITLETYLRKLSFRGCWCWALQPEGEHTLLCQDITRVMRQACSH